MTADVVLAAAKQAADRVHPLWHYLVIPGIGAVLFAIISIPDLIRRLKGGPEQAPDETARSGSGRGGT